MFKKGVPVQRERYLRPETPVIPRCCKPGYQGPGNDAADNLIVDGLAGLGVKKIRVQPCNNPCQRIAFARRNAACRFPSVYPIERPCAFNRQFFPAAVNLKDMDLPRPVAPPQNTVDHAGTDCANCNGIWLLRFQLTSRAPGKQNEGEDLNTAGKGNGRPLVVR